MSELTIKVTIPVLEELAKRDEGFVIQLSHAAAKEIGEKYADAIIQSAVMKAAIARIEKAIVAAQVVAGEKLEEKIGEWDNRSHTGYRLRSDVVNYIEKNFEKIISDRFNEWAGSHTVGEFMDKFAEACIEKKLENMMKKQIGEFLRRS